MTRKLFVLGVAWMLSSIAVAADGMISIRSIHDVAATADRLEAVLAAKGMTVFARVDHAAGAASVDLSLRPTQLLVFGNPRVGTPLMQCSQSVALDLPQKALIWEDPEGTVWLSYNDPAYLDARHGLDDCAAVLKKVSAALANVAAAATS
jgi:uncharacterized protein (DUF302 family)